MTSEWIPDSWMLGAFQASLFMAFTLLWTQRRLSSNPGAVAKLCSLALIFSMLLCAASFSTLPRPFKFRSSWFGGDHAVSAHESTTSRLLTLRATTGETFFEDVPIDPANHTQGIPLNQWSAWLGQLSSSLGESSWLQVTAQWLWYAVIAASLLAILRVGNGLVSAIQLQRTSILIPRFQWPQGALRIVANRRDLDAIALRVHIDIESPCVHALAPRTIYVPPRFLEWSDVEVETAMAHEVAHLQRRDPWWRLLGECLLVPLAFNPLAYLLRARLVVAQELATDWQAAALANSTKRYQSGLAKLCLRFDEKESVGRKRVRFCLGVMGVSSDLVRRIKMLQQHDVVGTKKPVSKGRAAALGLSIAALAFGSWTLQADEPIRVAAKVESKKDKPAEELFDGQHARPESGLPIGNGLIELRPNEISENSFLHPLLAGLNHFPLSQHEGKNVTLATLGIDISRVESLQATPQVTLQHTPNAEKPTSLSLGASSFYARSMDTIDWPTVIRSLDLSKIAPLPPEALEELAKGQSVSHELKVISGNQPASTATESPQMSALWEHVSGGVGALVAAAPIIPLVNDEDKERRQMLDFVNSLAAFGFGVDIKSDSPELTVRLVLTSKDGVSQEQFVSDFQALTRMMLAKAETMPDNVKELTIARNLNAAQVNLISDSRLQATVSVELPVNLAMFLAP